MSYCSACHRPITCDACKRYPCICYEREIERAKAAGTSRAKFRHYERLRAEQVEKMRLKSVKRKSALMEELPPNPTQQQVWADIHKRVREFHKIHRGVTT